MTIDRQKLYDQSSDFLALDGSAAMKLSRQAAMGLCTDAAAHGFVLVKVEGGIWANGTFEARLDAIWDGADPPLARAEAQQNNLRAARFIRSCDQAYNAFILTTAFLAGYLRQQRSPVAKVAEKA